MNKLGKRLEGLFLFVFVFLCSFGEFASLSVDLTAICNAEYP